MLTMRLRNLCFLAVVISSAACVMQPAESTACDGLAEKTLGITRADYSTCAGEILAALDDLERPLRRLVQGDDDAKGDAESANRRLRYLMRQVGFQADFFREVVGGASRTIERWPDSAMRIFNREVVGAAAQFGSALGSPNDGNLQEGARKHRLAKRAYERFR